MTVKMGIPRKRRKDRLILLYKGLKGKASIPTDLIPKTRRGRNQHFMAFQTPIANTDVYKGSFFPDYHGLECPPRSSDLICRRCGGLCC